jgi:hypothetical protein
MGIQWENQYIQWENQYTEFERCVEMPAGGTKLFNWQGNQMSTGPGGLDAKIREEITENEEGISVWSERRARLYDALCKRVVNMRINEY